MSVYALMNSDAWENTNPLATRPCTAAIKWAPLLIPIDERLLNNF